MKLKPVLVAMVISLMVTPVMAEKYQPSIEDVGDLELLNDEYNTIQHGGQWARCRQGHCYIMQTGEVIAYDPSAPDGIFLVFPEEIPE